MQATIHNEFLTLTVDTHGAEAVSLKNAAGQEMLWQADPAVWKRHAPILFPWTGKLTGGAFTHKGKTYKGGQHGFARDLEHTLLCAGGDTIRLELRSDEATKAERFPFDFVLTSTFRLEGKTLHHTLAVTNPADAAEELRFGIGYHPAFRIPFDDATASAWPVCAAVRWASTRRTPARGSSAMWRATPTPSSGRPRQSLCALSALSRGTPCPVPRLTLRSGAGAPLLPALPPARPGRPPSAQRLSAEAKFGKEMQEPLDRGDCILI